MRLPLEKERPLGYYVGKGVRMSVVAVRVGTGLGIAVGLFALVQSPAVTDAILLFAAAGVVPGTDIRLSPNATLWTMAGVLAGCLLLTFRQSLFGLFQRTKIPTVEPTASEPEPVAAKPVKARKSKVAPALAASRQAGSVALLRFETWLRPYAITLVVWVAKAQAVLWQLAKRWLRAAFNRSNRQEDLAVVLLVFREWSRVGKLYATQLRAIMNRFMG